MIAQQKTIAKLRAEIARLRGDDHPQLVLDLLKEQLEALQGRVFAPFSEKRPHAARADTDGPPQRGHGPRPQPSLPIKVVEHSLEPESRTCTACGGQLVEMGGQFQESEEITVVEASYKVVTHGRRKYRCACSGAVVTALAPPKLIPGGRYALAFAVHVAVQRYLDHLPLERQARAMGRAGLEVTSQTVWDQLLAAARFRRPSSDSLGRKVLGAEVVFVAETHWRLMARGSERWWARCVASEDSVAYWIWCQRSRDAAEKVLGGYEGVADGYAVYQSLARDGPPIRPVHCWADVRRKFIEAESSFPTECATALELIGRLYEIEREVPRLPRDVDAELRAEVVGRKNHEGSHLRRGIEVAALFCTLLESAKRAGVDPHAYVLEALNRAIDNPGTATLPEDLDPCVN